MTHYPLRPIQLIAIVALLLVLALVTLPALAGLRHDARDAICQDNLRQWHTAWVTYSLDHDGTVPPATNSLPRENWIEALAQYIRFDPGSGSQVWMFNGQRDTPGSCPSDTHSHGHSWGDFSPENYTSYGYNQLAMNYASPARHITEVQPETIILGDNIRSWYFHDRRGNLAFRHNGRANMVLADGSIYQVLENDPDDPSESMWYHDGGT